MSIFKNIEINPGDHVAFRTSPSVIPLPHMEAAVVEVKDGRLEVFSTLLVPYRHSGFFSEEEVLEIEVFRPADEAVKMGSRGKFERGQRIACTIEKEGRVECTLYAAFDGVVSGWTDDGVNVTGGINQFEAA
ncbi:MAG TPA: hypothetical protein VLV83_25125 [Acidobacteriota bacterium]|nr:hypothetical protein [Acidobacteriota bacterium]